LVEGSLAAAISNSMQLKRTVEHSGLTSVFGDVENNYFQPQLAIQFNINPSFASFIEAIED